MVSEGDIIRYLDDSGIDRAIVFGFPWEEHDLVSRNNDEIWEFHQRHPRRIVPFAVLSTKGGDEAYREAARTLNGGFGGIGELAMYHGGWSLSDFEALDPSLKLAKRANVPVMIHVNEPVGHPYPGKIPVDFRGLLHIIEANPEVDFILSHFGGGVFIYGLMPEISGILSRTFLDTAASPFLYDYRIFEIAVRIMGPEKIIFGSDYPLLPLARYLKEWTRPEWTERFAKAFSAGTFNGCSTRMDDSDSCSTHYNGDLGPDAFLIIGVKGALNRAASASLFHYFGP